MGHERIGFLPKTAKWKDVVHSVAEFADDENAIDSISAKTLKNVRRQLGGLENDRGFVNTFDFLVWFARSFSRKELEGSRKEVLPALDTFSLAKHLRELSRTFGGSAEYREIAFAAAIDAINLFYHQNASDQEGLFSHAGDPTETWSKLGSGSGFCQLARSFFAKFLERYLNYFLERAASEAIYDIEKRDKFKAALNEKIDQVSEHAFETARITQSFAAGWFNKHMPEDNIDDRSLRSFIRLALGKMREELLRESRK